VEKWFAVLWLLTNCKNGISSYELARALQEHHQRVGRRVTYEALIGGQEPDTCWKGAFISGAVVDLPADNPEGTMDRLKNGPRRMLADSSVKQNASNDLGHLLHKVSDVAPHKFRTV
jgi:hypothetical protein